MLTLRPRTAGRYLPLGLVIFDTSFTSFHFLFLNLDYYCSRFLGGFYCSCMHNKSNFITVIVNSSLIQKDSNDRSDGFHGLLHVLWLWIFFPQLLFLSFKMMWPSTFFKLFWTKFKNGTCVFFSQCSTFIYWHNCIIYSTCICKARGRCWSSSTQGAAGECQ